MLAILALGVASRPLTSANFAWSRAVQSASLGLLACLALFSPILADWLPNLHAHAYVDVYAPYRKPPVVDVMRALEWVGLAPFALALAGAIVLWRNTADRRLLILTLGSVDHRRRAVLARSVAGGAPLLPDRSGAGGARRRAVRAGLRPAARSGRGADGLLGRARARARPWSTPTCLSYSRWRPRTRRAATSRN